MVRELFKEKVWDHLRMCGEYKKIPPKPVQQGDHLRMCGEYRLSILINPTHRGSPPHVRRIQ